MKLITRETDYAIRALVHIAKSDKEIVTVTDLVETTAVPRPFLRKLLQTLNREGVLKSFKGKSGGFTLALSPEEILITRIITIFQGTMQLNECMFKKDICPNTETCSLRKILNNIQDYATRSFAGVTLKEIMKEEPHES
ncbi:MAG: Rrf2 family transcriptional regulator [Candidatus Omnitrophica bacterium]|nr:Rrf2 family transcriptional regulator [Candidatus Omnitrophota bacterium]